MTPSFGEYMAALHARAAEISDKGAKFAAAKRMVADGRISFGRYLMTANDTGNAVCVHCRGYTGAEARHVALRAVRHGGFRDLIAWATPGDGKTSTKSVYVIVFRSPYGGLAAIDHAAARKIGLALY
jgi:hypothetical protein